MQTNLTNKDTCERELDQTDIKKNVCNECKCRKLSNEMSNEMQMSKTGIENCAMGNSICRVSIPMFDKLYLARHNLSMWRDEVFLVNVENILARLASLQNSVASKRSE